MKHIPLLTTYFRRKFQTNLPVTTLDTWNGDYEGIYFVIDSIKYHSRIGKKTSKKSGYFTTFWTKNLSGTNSPYTAAMDIDYLIIAILDGDKKGLFVFPKTVLIQKGILTSTTHKGKMGFRVYAPWDVNLNKTATTTASWQQQYFVDFSEMEK